MLENNLLLQLIVLYLLFVLLLVFTMKVISEKNLYSSSFENKVLSLPLGKYLDMIIQRSLRGWESAHNYWIYLLLVFLIIFTISNISVSTSIIYVLSKDL